MSACATGLRRHVDQAWAQHTAAHRHRILRRRGVAGSATRPARHRFFKIVVGSPRNAASLLADVMPKELTDGLDLDHLTPVPAELFGNAMQRREADRVFVAPWRGQEMFFHLHVEHQHDNDPLMAARCWVYAAFITAMWMEAHPRAAAVPPVVSVVVHQGGKGRWTAPAQLADIYHLDPAERARLSRWLYRGGYILDDLHAADAPALRARNLNAQVLAALMTLKIVASAPDVYHAMLGIAAELQAAGLSPGGVQMLLRTLEYLDSSEKMSAENLDKLFDQLGPQAQEAAVTLQQIYEAKGEARGEAKGEAKGEVRREAKGILRVLKRRSIAVDDTSRQRIESCTDLGTLETWFDRAFDVSKAEDLFND